MTQTDDILELAKALGLDIDELYENGQNLAGRQFGEQAGRFMTGTLELAATERYGLEPEQFAPLGDAFIRAVAVAVEAFMDGLVDLGYLAGTKTAETRPWRPDVAGLIVTEPDEDGGAILWQNPVDGAQRHELALATDNARRA